MEYLFERQWLMFFLVVNVNGAWYYYKLRAFLIENPEFKDESKNIVLGYLGLGNLPVVGLALIHYYSKNPFPLNPIYSIPSDTYSLFFHFSLWFLFIVIGIWIFIGNGANFLSKYLPFISRKNSRQEYSIVLIKIISGIVIIANLAFLIAIYSGTIF